MIVRFTLMFAVTAELISFVQAGPPSSDPVQVAFGQRLAQRYCGECHAVNPGAKSPFEAAPRLPELFKSYPVDQLAEDLAGKMTDNHRHMTDIALGPDEVSAITAYLLSFAPPHVQVRPSG